MKRLFIHIAFYVLLLVPATLFGAIKIMPLGGSITSDDPGDARDSTERGGYRQYLWYKLDSANFDVDFVGNRQGGHALIPAMDVNHEGWTGGGAQFFANNIYSFLAQNKPDVILIHLGTYEVDTSTSVSTINEILEEVDRFETDSAINVTVVIAQIINRTTTHAATSAFNDSLDNLVAQRKLLQSDDLILVDFENGIGLNYSTDMFDTIHPNSLGYEKIATGWFNVLDTLLREDVSITSSPKLSGTVGNAYEYNVTADGSPLPVYEALTSPAGMSVSSSGQISWTPVDTGEFSVSIRAYNSFSSDTQNFVVKVYESYCETGMIHYWKLDDGSGIKASDSYDGADGTLVSSPVWTTNGKLSKAVQFSGSNYINASYVSSFDFSASGSFTVEAWALSGFVGGADDKVIIGRKNGTNNYWYIGAKGNTGNARFVISSQIGQSVTLEGPVISDFSWHHIVGVYSGSTNKCYLYVDGVAVDSVTRNFSTNFSSTENVTIASLNNGGTPGNFFAGVIDEAALYNTSLSKAKIADHYSLVNAGYHYCQYTGPIIQSQVAGISINEDNSRTIALTDLTVTDPNNVYPDDFILIVDTGANYSLSGFLVTPDENFDDTLYVPVQVSDGEFTSDTFTMVIPVTPFDDAPTVLNPLSDIICNEDTSTITVSIANVFNDVDNNNASMTYQVLSGYDTNIVSAIVNALNLSITPKPDKNGITDIVLQATSNGKTVTDTFKLTINAKDEAPNLENIVDQIIVEGDTFPAIDLDTILTEVDGDSVTISFSGNNELIIDYDTASRILQVITPDINWFGQDTIVIKAKDVTVAELYDSIAVLFEVSAVDDEPFVKTPINDITVNEDAADTIINLTNLFSDVDNTDSLIALNVVSNSAPQIVSTSLNAKNLTLTYQPDKNGLAQIVIQGTSNILTARDTFMVTINAVDDEPVLASISSQSVQEGSKFDTINLLDYLIERDNDSIIWSYQGNTDLAVNILATADLIVTAPDSNWFGTENISIIARDNTLNQYDDTVTIQFTINAVDDAPYIFDSIGDIILQEDHADTIIKLTDHISDIDNADSLISFSIISNTNIALLQTTVTNDTLTLHLSANKNGQAQLLLRALSNGKFLTDTIIVTVPAVDDYPVVSAISGISISEGDSILPINLETYLTNVDEDSVIWSVLNNVNITPVINGNVLSFSIPDTNWFGTENWQIVATDFTANEYSDTVTLNIEVENIDDPPYVANPISDIVLNEDNNVVVPLATVFNDIDNDVNNITKTVQVNDTPSDLVTAVISLDTLRLTMKANTSGSATVIVTGTSNGRSVTDTYLVTVLPVDDEPVLAAIPNKTIMEGGSFANINLVNYLTELDGDSIIYNYMYNDELLVSITPLGLASITTPDSNWFGQDTITFKVMDSTFNSYFDTVNVIFTVQAVDDPPYTLNPISDLFLNEDTTGVTVDLSNVFNDIDDVNDSIILEIADNTFAAINSLSLASKILNVNLSANEYGEDSVIIRATSNGKSISDTFKIVTSAVDDKPIIGLIPDQTINEGEEFSAINLTGYLTNYDIDSIVWSYIGVSELTVTITDTIWALIETPSVDWNGTDTITFIATDDTPNSLSDSVDVIFKVDPEDDAPYVLNPLDTLTANEDTSLITIDISAVFDDIDNDNNNIIKFISGNSNTSLVNAYVIGNNLYIDLFDNKNGNASIQLAGLSNGKIARDTLYLNVFPVDDAPSLVSIPPKSIDEGGTFSPINLNNYLKEVDNDSVTWEVTHSANFISSVTDTNYWYVSAVDSNWYGDEFIQLKVTDLTDNQDSAIVFVHFTINNVDDDPFILSAIKDTIIDEDAGLIKIPLDSVFSDIDNNDNLIEKTLDAGLNLSVITASIADDTLYINTLANEHGSDTIIVIGTSNGRTVSDTFSITVLPVDDYPELATIVNQTINEGGSFTSVNLNDYLTEYDGDSVTWSALPSSYNIDITPAGIVTVETIDPEWFGSDTLSFIVTDFTLNEYSDTATTIFVTQAVDDAPYVANPLSDLIRNEDAQTDSIFIGDVFYDIDNDTALLDETVINNSNISLLTATAENNYLYITYLPNKHGSAQLILRGTSGGKNAFDTLLITVIAVDDTPVVSGIPTQTINEGGAFSVFDLDNYLTEVDDDTILWTYTNDGNLNISINGDNEALIVPLDEDWFGTENLSFIATDKTLNALSGFQDITFTVEPVDDAPYVLDSLPDLIIPEDTAVITIDLLPVFDDIDNNNEDIVKTVKSNTNTTILSASITGHELKLTAKLNQHGSATITILATSNGKTTEEAFNVEILPVDDYPILSGIPNQTINEGETFVSFDLSAYLTEYDGDEINWGYTDENELSVILTDSIVNIETPDENWFGTDTISFIAYDNTINQFSDTFKVIFKVNPVDDAPYVVAPLSNIIKEEDAETIAVYLRGRFGDIDNSLDDFAYSVNFNTNPALINAYILNDTLYVDFLDNMSGFGLVSIKATTSGKSVTDQFNVVVTSVNDSPEFSISGYVNEFEDFLGTKTVTVSLGTVPTDELLQVVTYSIMPSSVDFINVSFNASTGTASFTSKPGETGYQLFTITANDGQSINNTYSDTFSVTIKNKFSQTIEYDSLVEVLVSVEKLILDANATSGLDVGYTVLFGPGTLSGDTLIIQGVGEIEIEISQPGNQYFYSAESVIQKVIVNKQEQSITFDPISDVSFSESFIVLDANASSGLPVSYNLLAGDGFISKDTLHFNLPGEFSIEAEQQGNENYFSAEKVTQSLNVLKLTQTITFNSISDKEYVSEPFKLNASSNSELPVSFEVISGNVELNNDTVTIIGTGEVMIRANQNGNEIYEPAISVEETFFIEKSHQIVSYDGDTTIFGFEESPIKLLASSSVGLPVIFAVDSGNANIINDSLYAISPGYVKVKISQSGNENYFGADTTIRLLFGKANQTITFSLPDEIEYTDSLKIQLQGVSSSGLPISYALLEGKATLIKDEITVKGTGVIIICASQNGNNFYNAAEQVCDTVVIYKDFVDLGILSIIEPDLDSIIREKEPVNFNLLLKNYGELPVNSFTVKYNVNDGKLTGERSYKVELFPGDTFEVYFNAQWVPRDLHNKVCFTITDVADDQVSANQVKCIEFDVTPTVIESFNVAAAKVYPNPVKELINFELPDYMREGVIQIYDTHSRLITVQQFSGYKNEKVVRLNLNYASGIYYYKIISGQTYLSGKFIVE